jgi:surface-adhesin protein E
MKLMFLLLVFVLASTSLTAQNLPEWYRIYTFDESIIEMNTSLVTFGGKDIARVRFRWVFDQPETLGGERPVKYKSRLEVMEFDCSDRRYRLHHVSLFDAAGEAIRHELVEAPDEWRTVRSGSMMVKLFEPACRLIKQKTRTPESDEAIKTAIELERVTRYALSFSQHLERAKNFKPIIEEFFVTNYLDGYLQDPGTNWFLNLDRDTAARVSRRELQRYNVALLNAGYLSCVYLISQYPSDSDEPVSEDKLIPPDIIQLIRNHPYTAAYKRNDGNYDYLAEKIDSVERLWSYTDLLEKVAELMQQHVVGVGAADSKEYLAIWDFTSALYQPKARICAHDCLGLPKGTRVFEVSVPVFRLQLAEINGNLKVVSARSSFQ